MKNIQKIIKSINETMLPIVDINFIPTDPGLYGFVVNNSSDLGKFGKPSQIIYVGLAEKSLYNRDFATHLNAGKTGWSSFRRSLGAILKSQLSLKAQERDLNSTKVRADKYKFDEKGERALTSWMRTNLKFGFWIFTDGELEEEIRHLEMQLILELKPTLDLDRRTKKYNPLATDLNLLRKICRDEVISNHSKKC